MKRMYILLILILGAMITLNIMVLYVIDTRPSTSEIQKLVDNQTKLNISEAVADRVQKVLSEIPAPTPAPVGPKGDPGASVVGPKGATGASGKDGMTIVGPAGPKGDPGAPGREIQLAKDPTTGDLYMRYTGDTAWSLVESP